MDVKTNSVYQEKTVREAAIGWSTPDLQALFQVNENRPAEVAEDKNSRFEETGVHQYRFRTGGSLVLYLCKEKTEWEAGYGR